MLFSFPSRSSSPARVVPLVLAAAAAMLLAACGGDTQESEAGYSIGAPLEDTTLAATAEAKGFLDTLTAVDMERGLNQLTRGSYARMPDSTKQQVQRFSLDRFVNNAAQVAEARSRGIEADTSAISQQMQQLRAQLRMQSRGQMTLEQQLERSGVSMAELRRMVKEQVIVRKLHEQFAEEVEDPTADEIAEYRSDQAREVRTQQIVFDSPPTLSAARRDSVRMRARSVLDSIQGGDATFDQMAGRYGLAGAQAPSQLGMQPGGGQDPSAPAGGSDYQTRGQMAGPYMQRGQNPADVPLVEAAFALEDSGAVADELVRTPRGFHIVRQTGSRTGTLMDSSQAVSQLTRQRRQEVVQDALEDLNENVTLRVNPTLVTADMTKSSDSGANDDEGQDDDGE